MEGKHISVSEQRGTELTLGHQVVLPQGAVVSKGLMEKGQALAPKEEGPWFGHLSSRFHPSLEGQLQGLSGMLGTGAGGLIPLHPTMSKEKEKPHNHPLFPHHSCSDSCNSASINPCPSPAGLNWGGDLPKLLWSWGATVGVTPHPLPPQGCSSQILLLGTSPVLSQGFASPGALQMGSSPVLVWTHTSRSHLHQITPP